eukprot:IDg10887t1
MHDSKVARFGYVCSDLKRMHQKTGGRCVVDSAFSRERFPFLLKSGQDALLLSNNSLEYRIMRKATSARQSAEWGMRALQGLNQLLSTYMPHMSALANEMFHL